MTLHLVYPAIANHLKTAVGLDAVFVGDLPTNIPPPYLFVWGPIPVEESAPLALVDERLHVQVVHKGTPDANGLATSVIAALEDFTPTVVGYDCQPLRVRHTTVASTERQVVEPTSNARPAYLTVVVQFRANKKLGENQ